MGVSVEKDDVVAHQRRQHYQHLQLIVHPQENRAGDQTQNAAVYKVLGQENTLKQHLGSLLRNAEIRIKIGGHHQAHWSFLQISWESKCLFLLFDAVVNACAHLIWKRITHYMACWPSLACLIKIIRHIAKQTSFFKNLYWRHIIISQCHFLESEKEMNRSF